MLCDFVLFCGAVVGTIFCTFVVFEYLFVYKKELKNNMLRQRCFLAKLLHVYIYNLKINIIMPLSF